MEVGYEPAVLKAKQKNEIAMLLKLNNNSTHHYWCECVVAVKTPLSLANDKDLHEAKMRMGIVAPSASKQKKLKLYTAANVFPDTYSIGLVAYVYDEDGAIAERLEQSTTITCEE